METFRHSASSNHYLVHSASLTDSNEADHELVVKCGLPRQTGNSKMSYPNYDIKIKPDRPSAFAFVEAKIMPSKSRSSSRVEVQRPSRRKKGSACNSVGSFKQMIESFIKTSEGASSLKGSALHTPVAGQSKRFFSYDSRNSPHRTPKLNLSNVKTEASRDYVVSNVDSIRSSSAVTCRFYEFEDARLEMRLCGHSNCVNKLTMVGESLWSAGTDYRLCKWNLPSSPHDHFFVNTPILEPVLASKAHGRKITALCTVSWNTLSSGSDDGRLKMWTDELSPLGAVSAHKGPVKALEAISSHSLISGGNEGTIKLWDSETLSDVRQVYEFHRGSVNVLKSHSNSTFFSGGSDSLLCLWDCRALQPVRRFEESKADILSVCLWDDWCVFTGGLDTCVKKWDIRTGGVLNSLETPHATRSLARFDELLLAGGKTVQVWRGNSCTTEVGHRGEVRDILVSDDHFFTASSDCSIGAWEIVN